MGKDLAGSELGKGFRQRKDGRYEARATINGKKINIIDANFDVLCEKYANAVKLIQEEIDSHKENYTLDRWYYDWFQRYKRPKVKNDASAAALNRNYKNYFGVYIGNKTISDLTSDDIQDVLNMHQINGKNPKTVRNGLVEVEQCLNRAVVSRYIPYNPCTDLCVSWDYKKKRERRFLTNDEQIKFLHAVDSSWYKEMFYVMLLTGMRIGEIGGLKWEDIDFKRKLIHVRRSLSCNYNNGTKVIFLGKTKTENSVRDIPFIGECEEMLLSQKKKVDDLRSSLGDRYREDPEHGLCDFVFVSTMGSPVIRYIAEQECNKAVEDINLAEMYEAAKEGRAPVIFQRVWPHSLRHTFISSAFSRGLKPKAVQLLVGHAHLSTTVDIYMHMPDSSILSEAKKFGSIMNSSTLDEQQVREELSNWM